MFLSNPQLDSKRILSTRFSLFLSFCLGALSYLMVYSRVPSSLILSSLLGMVMLCATDFFPLWKKVSGVQILLAIRLFRGKIFIGPWNFNLSSFQLCRKKTSMVYSWEKMRYVHELISLYYYFSYDLGSPCIKTRLIPTQKNAKLHTDGQFITTNFTCQLCRQSWQVKLTLTFPFFQIASLQEGETHTHPVPSQLTQLLFS